MIMSNDYMFKYAGTQIITDELQHHFNDLVLYISNSSSNVQGDRAFLSAKLRLTISAATKTPISIIDLQHRDTGMTITSHTPFTVTIDWGPWSGDNTIIMMYPPGSDVPTLLSELSW